MLHLLLAAAASTCGVSSRPATLTTPPVLNIPDDVHFTGVRSARLRVLVNADGTVGSAAIARTSGIRALDQQALADARTAVFQPAIAHCKAVARWYEFIVNFDPTQTAPEATAVPGAPCPVTNREARMAHLEPPAVNPQDIGDGAVTLDIVIDKDGDITSYSLAKSSGSAGLDNQVIVAAKASKYLPKLVNCTAVGGGHYIFRFKL